MEEQDKAATRKTQADAQARANANSAFNADGTPNTAFQNYEITKAGAPARARASTLASQIPGGPFVGRTEDERLRNILVAGDPASPEYASAYAKLAAPRVSFDPQTGQQITVSPDMSWARVPSRGGSPPGTGAVAGQTLSAPGQPTVTATPGRAASPARATFDANLNQAQSDVDLAERLLFPKGQFDRGMAMSGAAGIPLTQGREARQAIRRAVEIILRLRTGAAAPDQEVRNYVNMFAPSALDSDEGAKTKMDRLRQFFEDSKQVSGSKLPAAPNGVTAPLADPLGIR
jgi:hypothetical protein